MDTRLPRPAARSGRPEGLQPAAPPPDVEQPVREEAESGLEVIFPFSLPMLGSLPFLFSFLIQFEGAHVGLMFCSSYLDARLISPWVVTDEGRVFVDVAGPWVVCSLFK